MHVSLSETVNTDVYHFLAMEACRPTQNILRNLHASDQGVLAPASTPRLALSLALSKEFASTAIRFHIFFLSLFPLSVFRFLSPFVYFGRVWL